MRSMRLPLLVFALSLALSGCNPREHTTLDRETGIILPASATTTAPDPTGTLRPTEMIAPSSTVSKTLTETPSSTPAPTKTLSPTALPPLVLLEPVNHQWQSLNNCHRASISALMAYYGVWFSQNDYDLGMDNLDEFLVPYELGASIYATTYAQVSPSYAVRWLLASGIPVIMGQALSRDDNTWHYRVVHGYNDQVQTFTITDPLLGPNIALSYDTFDSLSRSVGQIIPVYPREMENRIAETMKAWQMKRIQYP